MAMENSKYWKNVINQAFLTVLVKETETKYPIEPGKIDIF